MVNDGYRHPEPTESPLGLLSVGVKLKSSMEHPAGRAGS